MKRIFLAVSLTACLVSFSSFASEKNYPDELNSFYRTFKKAKNVNWTEVDGLLRIGFILDGQQRFAYYSNDELIVVATQIEASELPVEMRDQLSLYKDYKTTQAYILEQNARKEYCVVLDNSSKHIVLKGKNKWRTLVEKKK